MEKILYGKHTKDCYYSNLWDAYIFDYYENNSFPIFGWIKPCIYCINITSSYITKFFNDKKIIIHACRSCIKNNKNNMIKENKIKNCLNNAMYFCKNNEDYIIV